MLSLAGRRVLVTGARGFIGSVLARRLAASGALVHAVSRQSVSKPGDVTWHQADLLDCTATSALVKEVGPELLFHVAGHPVAARERDQVLTSFRGNLVTTVHLLAAADEVKCARVVLAGSLEEPLPGKPASSPYALSKSVATQYGDLFYRLYGTPVVHCRVFMTYGPGQLDLRKLIPYTALALLRGERPAISTGERLVDWVYVDDVADGLIRAGSRLGLEGSSIDLGTGRLTSVREVVAMLVKLTGASVGPEFGLAATRTNEEVRAAASDETRRQLDWTPAVPLLEGLARTVAWCRGLEPRSLVQ